MGDKKTCRTKRRHCCRNGAYIQLGIVSSLDLVCGKVLLHSLPNIDDISVHINSARVQGSFDESEEEGSMPKYYLHSMHLGTSMWLLTYILYFVGDATGILTILFPNGTGFCSENVKKQMLKMKQ